MAILVTDTTALPRQSWIMTRRLGMASVGGARLTQLDASGGPA